ncbi:MAG: SCP2 sterol-binding domain-containing protein [Rhodospirillales bacterium]|nr:SCP2 sterol-binding domain-containing protein [Alphaproteobacteria bacterium]MCB9986791.1 SCP2 sterol-binding domain-containing protein [Rhodospirillales bacterium]USO08441.1 MAG: SCP2 sterol-binding domain-containing protein [Rhodospirillales bacterium]
MTLDTLIARFQDKLKTHPDFRATVKFDLGADGILLVDSTSRPGKVAAQDGEAQLTLTLAKDLLLGFMAGTKDPNVAYLTGKLKVKGPMGLAMKLNALLED